MLTDIAPVMYDGRMSVNDGRMSVKIGAMTVMTVVSLSLGKSVTKTGVRCSVAQAGYVALPLCVEEIPPLPQYGASWVQAVAKPA